MKVKYTDQQYQKGKETNNKREKQRDLDKDLWSTTYLTDIPDSVLTDIADNEIASFIAIHFGEYNSEAPDKLPAVVGYTISRNGIFKMWQFTVVTSFEVTVFEITE